MGDGLFSWERLSVPIIGIVRNYIPALGAQLKQKMLLPTGDIGLDNFLTFLEAVAASMGIGSQLFDKQIIENKYWEALTAHFEKFVRKIQTQKILGKA
jgi:2-dehydro-3-deoxyphosphogluconate aldolase/(4S)-4-hydroxy-2-oxoglutarate aldolase